MEFPFVVDYGDEVCFGVDLILVHPTMKPRAWYLHDVA